MRYTTPIGGLFIGSVLAVQCVPVTAGETFKKLAGVNLVHVPYKGSPPAVTATLAGEVALTFATTGSVLPHVKSGKVRALAVTTAARFPLLPDLPPIADTLPPGVIPGS